MTLIWTQVLSTVPLGQTGDQMAVAWLFAATVADEGNSEINS